MMQQTKIFELVKDGLKSRYDVVFDEDSEKRVAFFSRGIKFGYIKNEVVYLLNASGNFQQIDTEILSNSDDFLRLATKALWLATNKT